MANKTEKGSQQPMSEEAKAAAAERQHVLADARAKLAALRQLAAVKVTEVPEEFSLQATLLDEIASELRAFEEGVLAKTERPSVKRKTAAQLAADIRHFRSHPDCDDVSVTAMEEQLELLAEWDRIRAWQEELTAFRAKLDTRRESNRKSYDRAREYERKQGLLRRVTEQRLLGGRPPLDWQPKATDLVTLEFEVPVAAQTLLAPPVLLPRRLERLCGAAVDRAPERNRSRVLFITVLACEQEFVVSYLQETDWSGGCRVKLDPKVLPQLIGKGGAGLRAMEDANRCIININEGDVVVYGRQADSKATLAQIAATKAERAADSATAVVPLDHPAIARALNYSMNRLLREVEKVYSVNTRVAFGSVKAAAGAADAVFGADVNSAAAAASPQTNENKAAGGSAQRPEVSIRGPDTQSVQKAKTAIEEALAGLRCMELPLGDAEAAKRLFSRVSFNGEIDLARIRGGGGGGATVGDKFLDLASTVISRVAFLRHGESLAIVGTAADVAEIAEETKELVKRAGYSSFRMPLQPHQVASFRRERLAGIEAETGATVSIVRVRSAGSDLPATSIEICGSEEQKAAAREIMQNFLENEKQETVQVKETETLQHLLHDQAAYIKTLQTKHGVRISADRQSKTVQIIGPAAGIAAVAAAISKEDAEIGAMIVKTVPIPHPTLVGRLIGARGANISNIRNSSGVASIDIRDNEQTVVLKGAADAIGKAVEMIQEVFDRETGGGSSNTSKRTPTTAAGAQQPQSSPGGFFGPAGGSQAHVENVVARAPEGRAWGESVVPEDDEELGGSTTAAATAYDNGPDAAAPRGWQSVPAAAATATTANSAKDAPSTSAAFFPALGEEIQQSDPRRRPRTTRRPGRRPPPAVDQATNTTTTATPAPPTAVNM